MSSIGSSASSSGNSSPMISSSASSYSASSVGMDMHDDPSVIVGLACRVPGATNPAKLWENIQLQRDLQKKMPADRFNVDAFYHPDGARKGTTNAKYGYFLDQDISHFDAGFFNISGKEAEAMDPQQRILLEVVYEALEDAGITLDQINGSRTSVFCGCFTNDYNAMTTKDLETYPKYTVTGTGNSILANRISYFYNLHGPSATIDTACSSSLVCFHMGNQSLRTTEADISIVVGSALHFDPNIFITMTDLGMLSTDGRCRTFDASGRGYVRGEGVCAAVLKRKSEAQLDGDSIRAIVRGTAVNHDGKKQGITLPSSEAQEDLIRRTYKDAGLDPADTLYFEAHGTGTAAGDPREARAIGAVFSPNRSIPLYVGSVKSNIGHLEGASGLAGVIKATLALETRKIPPNMHFNKGNSEIAFDDWKIQVPTKPIDWLQSNGSRRVSINSFGYGGTNAHVILEGYTGPGSLSDPGPQLPAQLAATISGRPFLAPLSSHSNAAGITGAQSFSNYLRLHENASARDFAHSLSFRRSQHRYRSFAIGSTAPTLADNLLDPSPQAKWTVRSDTKPRLGFVFTGQGAQWFAMGRQLIEKSPFFRHTLEKCDQILQDLPDAPAWSIVEELLRSKETSRLGETRFSQPVCSALQLAIVDLLKQWKIEPSAVVGHSSGEIAAAYASGILSFGNAMVAAFYRGLHMSNTSAAAKSTPGSMMAVGLSEAEVTTELRDYVGRLAVAAINSPSSITISGDKDAILELKDKLTERKIFARQLSVAQAFHSHHMLSLAPAYQHALENHPGFTTQPGRSRMFSSVTARLANPNKMGASYWAENMTGTVHFSDALTGILLDETDELNVDALVEIGPHAALKGPSRQVLQSLKLDLPYIATLTRGMPDFEGLLVAAGQLFSLGYPVDLVATNSDIFMTSDGSPVQVTLGRKLKDLPSYSWDHASYWAETRFIKEHRLRKHRHSILGAPIPGSTPTRPRWRNYLRQSELRWLTDHIIDGKVVFPAAGYVSMAIEAMTRLDNGPIDIRRILLRDISIKSALVVAEEDAGTEVILELQPVTTSAKSSSDTWFQFTICSFDKNGRCQEHCTGLICAEQGPAAPLSSNKPYRNANQLLKDSDRTIALETYYERLSSCGLGYGECFKLLSGDVQSGPAFATAPLTWSGPKELNDISIVHPAFLDASLHVAFAAIETQLGHNLNKPFIPTFVRSLGVAGTLASVRKQNDELRVRTSVETAVTGPRIAVNDVRVESENCNQLLVDMSGLELTALGNDSIADGPGRSLYFRTRWQPAFDSLKSAVVPPVWESIAEAMDVFAHQHANSKILQRTSNTESTRDILRFLGGGTGQRRRFQSLTAWPTSPETVPSLEALKLELPGLLNVAEPTEMDYDAVVITEPIDVDLLPFLKTGGIVISTDADLHADELTPIFSTAQVKAWRKGPIKASLSGPITLLMPLQASKKTDSIASMIESTYERPVSRETPTSWATNQHLSDNVVVLASLDTAFFSEEAASDEVSFNGIQRLLTSAGKNIVWVLDGALMDCRKPEQAIIVGLARSARSENDQLRLKVLDIPSESNSEHTSSRILEVLDPNFEEEEVAERDGTFFIPRIEADDALNSKLPNGVQRETTIQPLKEQRPLALSIGKVGLLETLAFGDDEEIMDRNLADDELELEVKASAINFRDIAASMGIIDDYRLGDECAGIVVRTGSCVNESDFKVGDRVVAWRPGQGAHRTLVRNPTSLCYKLGEMPFVTATAMPLILTTAHYALMDVARLQKGETVLIHSAAGGVGQMAIQIAQMVGAKVIATVGSQSKRDLLKTTFGLMDDQILSSREDSFVDGVMALTNRRGVDVALNSLAGKLLHATWSCIAPFGRFIEIGKRDIHENSKIDMDPFRKNVTFASVDLITMFEQNKELGARVFQECCSLVHQGKIQPPETITEVSYADAQKGFRLLQMGKVTGKVVLVPGEDDLVPVRPASYRNTKLFTSGKTYLLVGGLGGLGRTLCEWLVRKGAKSVAFLSRSGADSVKAQATVNWLESRKIKVSVYRGDVTDSVAVKRCVDAIGDSLAGVFQAAMVLQDKPLDRMKYLEWQSCLRPKVDGTLNLHNATIHAKLDFFVCFSSVSSILGSKAQANYSAANCYLDALMRHRRELGLKGTTMNCGMIVGVGAVAENSNLQTVMERIGYDPVNEEELLYQVEEAITADSHHARNPRNVDPHQIITGINLSKADLYWAQRPLFRNLYANHDFQGGQVEVRGVDLPALLRAAANLQERISILRTAFIAKIASVLAVPTESIQPADPLSAYGLDSIVAVEFRNWFAKAVSVDLALFDILKAKSISALVSKAAEMMVFESPETDKKSEAEVGSKSQTPNSASDRVPTESLSRDIFAIERPDNIPMSTFQSRLWFSHNMMEDSSLLNLTTLLHITGKPVTSALRQALHELIRRNDILRTSYFEGDEFAEQKVIEDFGMDFTLTDLSHLHEPQSVLKEHTESMRQEELDIEAGEVLRASLVKLSEEEHCLVLVIHHISIDRGSSKSFLTQLTAIYDSIVGQEELSAVPFPKITYSDFTLWHNDRLQSQVQDDIEFWKQKLISAPSSSKPLPFAKAERPPQNDFLRSTHHAALSSAIHNRMKRISARMGITPFQFLLAAFRSFLYRYTGVRDTTILMIDGNRPRPDLDDTLGFFVNMLPVRFTNDCENFHQLIQDTKSLTLEALEHSGIPFDIIADAVGAEKSPSHFPLGQVVVNYQMHGTMPNYPTADFNIHKVVSEDIPSACEINLEALEAPDSSLNLRLEYSTTLYATADMERFLENFTTLLTDAVKDHRQPVAEMNMCGPKELDHLKTHFWNTALVENAWNNTSVLEKILQHGHSKPESTAIRTSDGDSITFSDLFEKAQQVAGSLRAAGASPGNFVGLYCRPGIDAISGMLATLLVRCGYVSMDPEFAAERLAFMATDARVNIIMHGPGLQEATSEIASKTGQPCQLLDLSAKSSGAGQVLNTKSSPDDPFYMIYTSGSTGKPKGVVLTQSNTQAMLSTLQHDYDFSPKDRFLHHSSICFDLSIVQIFSALTAGATIYVASAEMRKDPNAMAEFMAQASITVTYFTPTQYALLMERASSSLRKCHDYRVAFFAGETLPPRVATEFYGLGTPATLYNTWSPSELVVQTTIEKVEPSDLGGGKIPIGYPMANARHYILDERCNPLPAGLVGEIAVGGPQVGQGYLNRPEVNAKSFIVNPFCSDEDQRRGWNRMFLTGDRGRFRHDGRLEFHGRVSGDKQIKLRGLRIDLTEIENRLFAEAKNSHKRLIDVCVVARTVNGEVEDMTDNRQLIAFLVPSDNLSFSSKKDYVSSLHEELAKHLNAYMLPNGYQFLENMPVTIGGKVNRQDLLNRSLHLTFPSTNVSNEATTQSEHTERSLDSDVLNTIMRLFREILKLPADTEIAMSDNFFQLGGQSILLLRFHSKLKKSFQKVPPLPELFKRPTPEAICQAIQSSLQSRKASVDGGKHVAQEMNWSKEAALPYGQQWIVPYGIQQLDRSDVTQTLVTGVDSYIGIHMLATLLSDASVKIIHLLGSQRDVSYPALFSALDRYQLMGSAVTKEVVFERTRLVPGNLGKPHFGLSQNEFRQLGEATQRVYHLGGAVSLLKSYEDLRQMNVAAALDIIELASLGRTLTEIHHLSTWSVPHLQTWNTAHRTQDSVITSEVGPDHFRPEPTNKHGYFKSRWVSEMLMSQAAERGFAVSIYRSSAVSGNMTPGVPEPSDDFIRRMVLSMVQSRCIPQIGSTQDPEFAIDFIPVKHLTTSMHGLASSTGLVHPTAAAELFHLGNESPLPLSKLPALMGKIRKDGKEGQSVPLDEWLEVVSQNQDAEAQLRWAVLRDYFTAGHVMFALDRTETEKALEVVDGKVMPCPPVDEVYLRRILGSV